METFLSFNKTENKQLIVNFVIKSQSALSANRFCIQTFITNNEIATSKSIYTAEVAEQLSGKNDNV